MEKKLIIQDGDFSIYRVSPPVLGGSYAVVDSKNKKAKNGLCLDAAFEIFRQLTLEAELKKKNMIE